MIGIDGHELGEVFGLTTISQDPKGQGAAAVAAVLSLLAQESMAADWIQGFYPTEFVVRSSTSVPADLRG